MRRIQSRSRQLRSRQRSSSSSLRLPRRMRGRECGCGARQSCKPRSRQRLQKLRRPPLLRPLLRLHRSRSRLPRPPPLPAAEACLVWRCPPFLRFRLSTCARFGRAAATPSPPRPRASTLTWQRCRACWTTTMLQPRSPPHPLQAAPPCRCRARRRRPAPRRGPFASERARAGGTRLRAMDAACNEPRVRVFLIRQRYRVAAAPARTGLRWRPTTAARRRASS